MKIFSLLIILDKNKSEKEHPKYSSTIYSHTIKDKIMLYPINRFTKIIKPKY